MAVSKRKCHFWGPIRKRGKRKTQIEALILEQSHRPVALYCHCLGEAKRAWRARAAAITRAARNDSF